MCRYPFTDDMNGYQQEGMGLMDATIHQGRRWSAAQAYLRPAMERDNVKVITNALAHRILFDNEEEGKEKNAVGVAFDTEGYQATNVDDSKLQRVYANKEVILCGGALNSPQLLLLSGIGDADALKSMSIPVMQHLPGVGQNMEDHLDTYVQYECKQPVTLYTSSWKFPHNMVATGLEWFLKQTGKAASAHLESGGFIRSAPGIEYPDIQFHFLPGALTGQLDPGSCHAMQAHCSTMRATSRGELTLASRNPRDHPIIDPNYMATEQDRLDYRNGIKLTHEIFQQKAFDSFRGDPISPQPADLASDDAIDAWIRSTCHSAYHPCATAKMGAVDDPNAVLDPETRVRGVGSLRVVDASIMPAIVTGNLNAPTIMLAEKAADIIKDVDPLPASDAPVYESPDWQNSQR